MEKLDSWDQTRLRSATASKVWRVYVHWGLGCTLEVRPARRLSDSSTKLYFLPSFTLKIAHAAETATRTLLELTFEWVHFSGPASAVDPLCAFERDYLYDLDICHIYEKFEGKGHRQMFTVTGGENDHGRKTFSVLPRLSVADDAVLLTASSRT